MKNESAVYVIKQDATNDKVKDTSDAVAGSQSTTSQYSTKKCVIVCVTCVVIVAMVIVGVLVAIKLITDSHVKKFHIDRQYRKGDVAVEDSIYEDQLDNSLLRRFHVQNKSGNTWGIDDYTKGLLVIKLQTDTEAYVCFVVENEPKVNQPQLTDATTNETILYSDVTFNLSEEPLTNPQTLLGLSELSLCHGLPVFTATRETSQNSDESSSAQEVQSRKKRRILCVRSTCRIFYFGGISSGRRYYSCRRICRNV